MTARGNRRGRLSSNSKHIPRHTRLSCEGNLGQPQKENRVSLNDLVERMNPFYEVILS